MAKTTTPDSDSPFVTLRNTISGVAQEFTRVDAERFLNHPTFGKSLVIVDTAKPEVLAEPYTIGNEGERIPVEPEEVVADVSDDTNGDIK